jgi:hypothetical protein
MDSNTMEKMIGAHRMEFLRARDAMIRALATTPDDRVN